MGEGSGAWSDASRSAFQIQVVPTGGVGYLLKQVDLLMKQQLMMMRLAKMMLYFAGRKVSPKSYQLAHVDAHRVLQIKECPPVK